MTASRLRMPPRTAELQLAFLRSNPICAGEGSIRRDKIRWQFDCTPTPMARTYRIDVKYEVGKYPDVFVIDPHLPTLAKGQKLPHVYSEEPTELCLWLPSTQEWYPSLRLDQTVIPWTYLWLDYFEDWLLTGDWKGGGEHPEGPEEQSPVIPAKKPRHWQQGRTRLR
jgi:hypothetical protein